MTPTEFDKLLDDYVAACLAGEKRIGLRARLHGEVDAAVIAEQTANTATAARLAAPGALKAAALWYAGQGVAVFPLKPRDKKPATVHGFKNASTDPAVIAAWWDAEPAGNIGTPTGQTFDVVDIDGATGVYSWATVDGLFDELREQRIGHSLTARDGGHHIFVKAVDGRGNRAGMFPGVDYRGQGGYVVLPPSIGANGQRYSWLHPLDLTK